MLGTMSRMTQPGEKKKRAKANQSLELIPLQGSWFMASTEELRFGVRTSVGASIAWALQPRAPLEWEDHSISSYQKDEYAKPF